MFLSIHGFEDMIAILLGPRYMFSVVWNKLWGLVIKSLYACYQPDCVLEDL